MSFVISIDVGGTNIRFALIDDQYRILIVNKTKTIKNNKQKLLNQIRDGIASFYHQYDDIMAISIGVPGRIDATNQIEALPNIGIKNIDLIGFLKKYYPLPIYLKNDAEMAVLGEAVYGVGKTYARTYFVTISTGLGGSLTINKWLAHGSGEIGHTLVKYKDTFHEYEKLISGTGVLKLTAINGLSYSSPDLFFDDVENGQKKAQTVFADWLDLLTHFFMFISTTFQPEVIAVTGGLMNVKHLFFDHLKNRCPSCLIVPSKFADDSGLIGAAVYAYNIDNH
jgi:glucokinase